MSLIITGSAGYIGTNLKKLLDKQGQGYVEFDRKINYDLLSPEGQAEFEHFAAGATTVIHLAAKPRIPESWTNTQAYVRDNIELTEYVARVCTDLKCHLMFASSSSVYGDGDGPLNPYAWTKQAGEDAIKLYAKHGLDYTIFRIFTTYGNQGPLVLDNWLRLAKNKQSITIFGDGTQSRDFVHVEDVARALYSAYVNRPYFQTLDIGTGQSHRLVDLAKCYNTQILFDTAQLGYAHSTQANAQPTMDMLDWAPTQSATDWIKKNLGTIPS